jgi:3-methyladenine DNA glycosylase AlkC
MPPKASPVPREVLSGTAEASTLTQILAIDTRSLFVAAFPDLELTSLERVGLSDKSVTQRMRAAGQILYAHSGLECLTRLYRHPSDTVRGWAAYVIGAAPDLSLDKRLKLIRPSADDRHFGVREWAWLGIRPRLASDIQKAIALLTPWTQETSPRLRRFATEATRPRGVWTPKIDALLEAPNMGEPLLSPLKSDNDKYVQDSVANWLNDAAKSKPAWVKSLCARWSAQSTTRETQRICSRALRSVNKK